MLRNGSIPWQPVPSFVIVGTPHWDTRMIQLVFRRSALTGIGPHGVETRASYFAIGRSGVWGTRSTYIGSSSAAAAKGVVDGASTFVMARGVEPFLFHQTRQQYKKPLSDVKAPLLTFSSKQVSNYFLSTAAIVMAVWGERCHVGFAPTKVLPELLGACC